MDKKELYKKVEDLHLFCIGISKYVALSEVMYYSSLNSFDLGGLLIFDKKVINTRNVTYTEIIKERVMNIDKHY